ncbi:MAG: hypothetical protein PUB10_05035 [Clostridiales bacterium]|nr:hypothetical protein [Clostridiales bacterium]
MKEKNKPKMGKIVFFLAVVSFLIATVEGFLFYTEENLFFRVLLIIQNSINAFGFQPCISLQDAMGLMQENGSVLYAAAGYAYGIAVFTAPYCTLAVMYKVLERIMHVVIDVRKHRNAEHIVIFGFNEDVKAMLDHYVKEAGRELCVHIVTQKKLSSEESYVLCRKGYKLHCFDVLKASEDELVYLLKKAGADLASNIILFEESSIRNFSLLQLFPLNEEEKADKIKLKYGAKITCRCDEDAIGELIADYYDSRESKEAGYDLEIISIPQLQVHKMYTDVPLHSYYQNTGRKLSEWNTRLMIVGFGNLGQQALLQAMNLGVVHEKNSIMIDVFDQDVKNKSEIFANQFSPDTFSFEENCFRLKEEVADGIMEIHFTDINVRYKKYMDQVRTNIEASPYTYVVIAIDDVNIAVNCAMKLEELFEQYGYADVPIMVRMDSDRRLAKYINGNQRTFLDVSLLEDKSNILTLNMIIDRTIDVQAKAFNHFYNNIQIITGQDATKAAATTEMDIEKEWNRILLFKRASSKAAAYHEEVKQLIMEMLAKENNIDLDKKIDELVGQKGSLFEYTGSAWRLKGSEEDFIKAIKKDEFAYSLASLEHRRWCYFMASMGWKNGARNSRFKQNPCLVTQEKLLETKPEMCKYDLMSLMARYKRMIQG